MKIFNLETKADILPNFKTKNIFKSINNKENLFFLKSYSFIK